jgi:DNA processing protein
MDRERFDRIRLARSARVGPVAYRDLLARFGSAGAALEALAEAAARGRPGATAPADARRIAREVAAVEALGARYIVRGDSDYPLLLRAVADAPPVLIGLGNSLLPMRRCVAMVGARHASAAACRFARDIARDLAGAGVVVVSGLARGIDAAAHQGALEADEQAGGGTVGVIASGSDIAYPPGNAALQQRMGREALVLTEYPPGTEPRAAHFPHRNRIIAGLAAATLVVEAAPKSGSLITARLAGDYGRDVLAVPGSPLDPRARGCNQLIREGAILIQSAADVLEMLTPFDARMAAAEAGAAEWGAAAEGARGPQADLFAPPVAPHPSAPAAVPQASAARDGGPRAVARLLGPVPVSLDELVRQSGLAPAELQLALLELELDGRLERHPGGRVSLA